MKIRPLGAELFHADRRTDGHDEANSRFSQFWNRASYIPAPYTITCFLKTYKQLM